MDKMQARLDRMPNAMGVRRQTVEHPFGTLKSWMGSTHFLTRTLEKVRTDEPSRPGLQSEENDPDLRRRAAHGGNQSLMERPDPLENTGSTPQLAPRPEPLV